MPPDVTTALTTPYASPLIFRTEVRPLLYLARAGRAVGFLSRIAGEGDQPQAGGGGGPKNGAIIRSPIPTQKRARSLRRSLTGPEQTLWSLLRRDQQQLHFRRQHAVGPYILDFYCAAAKLCVEVDGPVHADTTEHDERRTRWLAEQGVRVIRFSVEAVENTPAAVVAAIVRAAAPSPA